MSLKDFIVAWKTDDRGPNCLSSLYASDDEDDDRKMLALVSKTEHYPEIEDKGGEMSMLMPTAQWPFDHSMVLAQVNV